MKHSLRDPVTQCSINLEMDESKQIVWSFNGFGNPERRDAWRLCCELERTEDYLYVHKDPFRFSYWLALELLRRFVNFNRQICPAEEGTLP